MQALGIVGLCTVAAVAYGIVHDQITARVCVEYFTIGHPPVFGTDDPTVLGFGWGVIASWWVGALLGILLARASLAGNRPPRPIRSLVRPVFQLMLAAGVSAFCAGALGWVAASRGWVVLQQPLAALIPPDRHVRFLADLWAHGASYLVGSVGGGVICIRVWQSRRSIP